jgi:hypothetical protein
VTKSYRLGEFCFQLKSSNQQLCDCIGSLLERHEVDVDRDPLSLIDIDLPLVIVPGWEEIVSEASGLEIIRLIVRRALNYHHDYLWFDAATLVSPSGKVVLIAGPSHSGKSTAATALAFAFGWKILAEDVSLVDPRTKQVKTFASPISLRTGSLERIRSATGVLPGPVVGSEWVPISDHINEKLVDFNIDLSIALSVTDSNSDLPLTTSAVPAQSFIHSLLPLCNALHLNNGIELLDDALKNSVCFRIMGGSLAERLHFINVQAGEATTPIEDTARRK